MSSITLSTDEIVEAFCKMLEPGVAKPDGTRRTLPREDCNKYGVDVLSHKTDPYLIMFHFLTLDLLEVNIEFDLKQLQLRGKEYLDHLYGLLCDQTEKAREARQEDSRIDLYMPADSRDSTPEANELNPGPGPVADELPALKPTVAAHNKAMETLH